MSGSADKSTVAIACGGGQFPEAVINSVLRQGRPVFLFLLRGFADPKLEKYPHAWANLGSLSTLVNAKKEHNFTDFVMIGDVIRPRLSQIGFDWRSLLLLPRLTRILVGGDDSVLRTAARVFESYGLRLCAAHEIAPDILVPEGNLTRAKPSASEMEAIAYGRSLLKTMAPFDVGQGVVVVDGRAVAVEASEGTTEMLRRVRDLRERGRLPKVSRSGVLVKAPKLQQDRRFDLPAIGLQTVEEASAAGLAGIAVEAGGSIVTDVEAFASAADKAGLFVIAFPRETEGVA